MTSKNFAQHIERITGVRYHNKVTLSYTLRGSDNGEVKKHPFPKSTVPKNEFIDALQALKSHALKIAGVKLEKGSKLVIREVSLSNVENDDFDFVIKGVLQPAKGPGAMAFNTPVRSTREGPNAAPEATVFGALDNLFTAALNFARGDRAQEQAEMPLNGTEEQEPEAVPA